MSKNSYYTCSFCDSLIVRGENNLQILKEHVRSCDGNFTCEICNEDLPLDIAVNGEMSVPKGYSLIDSEGKYTFFIYVCIFCANGFC